MAEHGDGRAGGGEEAGVGAGAGVAVDDVEGEVVGAACAPDCDGVDEEEESPVGAVLQGEEDDDERCGDGGDGEDDAFDGEPAGLGDVGGEFGGHGICCYVHVKRCCCFRLP